MSNRDDHKRLAISIVDFLRSQLATREDLCDEDKESLLVAVECLESVYGVDTDLFNTRIPRTLPDIFAQASRPVKVKHRIRAESLKNLGNENMMLENFEDAEEAYSAAISLDKWNPIYYCNRAAARIRMHNYSSAIADCRKATSLNPDYAKAHAKMGQAYVLMESPRRAVRCFRQASRLEPDNDAYRTNLQVAEDQSENSQRPLPADGFERMLLNVVGPHGREPTPQSLFDIGSNLMRLVITDIRVSPESSPSTSGHTSTEEHPIHQSTEESAAHKPTEVSPTNNSREESPANDSTGNHAVEKPPEESSAGEKSEKNEDPKPEKS